MKRCYLWILGLILALPLNAQSLFELVEGAEGKIIVVPRQARFNFQFEIPEATYRSYTPASTYTLDNKIRQFEPEYQPASVDELPMDMHVLSGAYRPFYNIYSPMLRSLSPMAFDFRETSFVPLNEQFTFSVTGEQYTWPALGGITNLSPALTWQSGNFSVAGHAFGGRHFTPFNNSPGYNMGIGLSAGYKLNEHVSFKSWGQYAHYFGQEKFNPYVLMTPFYNRTNVGGAVELMINENVGVGAGVQYEYNPMQRKMKPQYLLYPILKNVKIGWW